MKSWLITRNTYEAAALAALDIAVKPITATDHKRKEEITEWSLAPNNAVALAEGARATGTLYGTSLVRREHAQGKLPPLHPYLVGLRALTNRLRLIDAQRGAAVHGVEEAPGSWLLQAGSDGAPPLPAHTPHITSGDLDFVAAAITVGARLMEIQQSGREHVYKVTRLAQGGGQECPRPPLDLGPLMQALREGALYPARRWEPFAHAHHTLHCLRVLRRHQHATTFITVAHKTPFVRGAAFNEQAKGDVFAAVQRKLGIRL